MLESGRRRRYFRQISCSIKPIARPTEGGQGLSPLVDSRVPRGHLRQPCETYRWFSRQSTFGQRCQMPVGYKQRDARGFICQRGDQHLRSAKKSTRGSRDNATKQSEGINGNKKRLVQVVWTEWLNCARTLQSRRGHSILARMKPRLSRGPLSAITLASNSCFPGLAGFTP